MPDCSSPRPFPVLACALGLVLTTGCDSQSAGDPGETAPSPAPTVTQTVAATPTPTRAADPEVEAAGARDDAEAAEGAMQDTIPARFHGDWSEDLAHCGQPGHQRYDIRAREVGFFESTGIVQDVRVNGDYAAATLSEQYGDAPPAVYVFYMAIEGPNTMRIRYDDNPRFRIYRCPN
ncbi:hypothetical protein AAW00_12445 [Aurantiacibacter luteus]|uniref:Uncharacterized protein n=2 Tax=Aurantiacibacter luteus TaxID=1581420 RepID=A0A0G9MSX9_9SPHN|nr:hypothetical protein AAW00_12445 [Aurantiacibacter luteus]